MQAKIDMVQTSCMWAYHTNNVVSIAMERLGFPVLESLESGGRASFVRSCGKEQGI
jgi:hypothetical protein